LFINGGEDRVVVADDGVDNWLSSFDDGYGDVHGVDEISDDDSSDVEDNEPERGMVSKLFDNVKLLNDGRGVLVGSLTYGRNFGWSFLGFCAFELNDNNNSASWTLTAEFISIVSLFILKWVILIKWLCCECVADVVSGNETVSVCFIFDLKLSDEMDGESWIMNMALYIIYIYIPMYN